MNTRKGLRIHVVIGVFVFFICVFSNNRVNAQIFNDSSNKYKVYVEPYLMFTSMSGTTQFGEILPPNLYLHSGEQSIQLSKDRRDVICRSS